MPRWGKLNNGISIPRVSRISGCLTVLIVTALIAELRADETSALPGQKNVRPPETADGLETTGRQGADYSAASSLGAFLALAALGALGSADASVTAAVPSEVALG